MTIRRVPSRRRDAATSSVRLRTKHALFPSCMFEPPAHNRFPRRSVGGSLINPIHIHWVPIIHPPHPIPLVVIMAGTTPTALLSLFLIGFAYFAVGMIAFLAKIMERSYTPDKIAEMKRSVTWPLTISLGRMLGVLMLVIMGRQAYDGFVLDDMSAAFLLGGTCNVAFIAYFIYRAFIEVNIIGADSPNIGPESIESAKMQLPIQMFFLIISIAGYMTA